MATPPASDPSTWTLPRLRIDRDGTWYHEDTEVTHAGIVANLREGLRRDGEGHYIQIGPVRIPVVVEDAPFLIVRVEEAGDGLAVVLNDDTREPLRAETLRIGARGAPYVAVKDGRFEARFNRAAAYQLLQRAEGEEGGSLTLVIGGRRYRVPVDSSTTGSSGP
jgi:hypothetical protein